MTRPVETALLEAEQAGEIALLDDLGAVEDVSREVVALANSPLAPLAAAALATAVGHAPGAWGSTIAAFADRLRDQHSLLALADTLDVLLDAPEAATRAARHLHDALLADHARVARDEPLLAAARLEGALRVALTGTVTPYRVLDRLADFDQDAPEEYLEALPRLIGIALDRWDTETALTGPLVAALEALRSVGTVAAGAAHELACRQLRSAMRESDPDAAVAGLAAAGEGFTEAIGLDAARDDAAVYAAVCSAVAAFGAGDADRLRAVTSTFDDVMRRRIAWHRRMHEPRWRQPLLDAEVEWLGLVIDLRNAADRLSERSWLESAAAVGQLARAYAAERSTAPAPGLTSVVRPMIVNVVMENATLLDQLARTIAADRERQLRTLPDSADLLLDAIRERRVRGRRQTGTAEDGADEEGDPAVDDRIDTLAPRLRLLGDDIARAIARRADNERLAELATIVAATTASGVMDHPALGAMRVQIIDDLSRNPAFDDDTRPIVIALLDTTLTFLLNRYDRGGPLWKGHPDICRLLGTDETPPVEEDLQLEFYIWVVTSQPFAGRADIEQRNIARGRVDVVVRMGDIQLVTEVKRELTNASRVSLEHQYIPQAAAYSGSNVPFSQLLVLDLTDHAAGVPPLRDLAWVIERRVNAEASPQHIVAAVVVGNRPAPSALRAGTKAR